MVCIGVIGEEKDFQTIGILMRLFKEEEINAVLINSECDESKDLRNLNNKQSFEETSFIVGMVKDFNEDLLRILKFDVVVYLKGEKDFDVSPYLSEKNIMVVNCDEKSIFPFSVGIGTTLVTSGVNSKATVTASSIVKEEKNLKIQTCIQRSIVSLFENEIEPQEFSIEVCHNTDASAILAAATVAMICDLNVGNIKIN